MCLGDIGEVLDADEFRVPEAFEYDPSKPPHGLPTTGGPATTLVAPDGHVTTPSVPAAQPVDAPGAGGAVILPPTQGNTTTMYLPALPDLLFAEPPSAGTGTPDQPGSGVPAPASPTTTAAATPASMGTSALPNNNISKRTVAWPADLRLAWASVETAITGLYEGTRLPTALNVPQLRTYVAALFASSESRMLAHLEQVARHWVEQLRQTLLKQLRTANVRPRAAAAAAAAAAGCVCVCVGGGGCPRRCSAHPGVDV